MELKYYLGGGLCLLILWMAWAGLYLGVPDYPTVVLIATVLLGIATVSAALLFGWVLLRAVWTPQEEPPIPTTRPNPKFPPNLIPFSYMTLGDKYVEYEDI